VGAHMLLQESFREATPPSWMTQQHSARIATMMKRVGRAPAMVTIG